MATLGTSESGTAASAVSLTISLLVASAQDVILGFTGNYNTADPDPSATFDAVSMDRDAYFYSAARDQGVGIFVLDNPDAGTQDFVVTAAASAEHLHAVVEVSGVDPSSLWRGAAVPGNGFSAEATVDVATQVGDVVVCIIQFYNVDPDTEDGTRVEYNDGNGSTDSTLILQKTATGTTTSIGTTLTGSSNWTMIARAIVPESGDTIDVPTKSLELTRYAPTAIAPETLDVPIAGIRLTRLAPTCLAPSAVDVPVAGLRLSRYAPVVDTQVDETIDVPFAGLRFTRLAPTVEYAIAATPQELELTTYAPTVLVPETVDVPLAGFRLTAYAPIPQTDNSQTIDIPVAGLRLSALAPGASAPATVTVPVAGLRLTTYQPFKPSETVIAVPLAGLRMTRYAPTIEGAVTVAVPVASLGLTRFAPVLWGPRPAHIGKYADQHAAAWASLEEFGV